MLESEQTNNSEPEKCINFERDLNLFHRSSAYVKLHTIFLFIIKKVRGLDVPPGFLSPRIVTRLYKGSIEKEFKEKKLLLESGVSPIVVNLILTLCDLDELTESIEPHLHGQRYGDVAFRDWMEKSQEFLNENNFLKELDDDVRQELRFYFRECFGSSTRLDYGTGHELNFIAFLGGFLEKYNLVEDISGRELLMIFATYYDLQRHLIARYKLEPAGSHGVWGLDDHFHFIYILGAAQFNPADGSKGNEYRFIPDVLQVLEPQILDLCKLSNLYVNSVSFIITMKTGLFYEHSPIIFDIHRSVTLWSKVLSGLQKMYEAEVFKKFPVVQHFHCGKNFYLWTDAQTNESLSPPPPPPQKTPVRDSASSESGTNRSTSLTAPALPRKTEITLKDSRIPGR